MIADVWCPWCRDHQRAELTADRDAHRTRADAAEAEVARLTACLTRANASVEAEERARYGAEDARDAALADAARLRAIVEGRTTAPTDAEIMAHARVVGGWVVTSPSWMQRVRGLASVRMLADDHRESEGTTWRWVPIAADGRPTAWPVPA